MRKLTISVPTPSDIKNLASKSGSVVKDFASEAASGVKTSAPTKTDMVIVANETNHKVKTGLSTVKGKLPKRGPGKAALRAEIETMQAELAHLQRKIG